MILYINSCVRPDSRTNELARHLLKKAGDEPVAEMQDFSQLVLTTQFSAADASNPFERRGKKKKGKNTPFVPVKDAVSEDEAEDFMEKLEKKYR